MKKLITLILALTLVVSLFAGCKKDETTDATDATATTDEKEGTSILDNLGEFEDKVLFKVNDSEIMLSNANILLYQIKSYYESIYGPTVWDMEAEAGVTVESYVKDDIKEVAVRTEVLYDYAMKNGLTLSEEKEEELATQATTVYESYTPEIIAKYGFTLEQLKDTIVKQGYSELVFDEKTKDFAISDADLKAEMEKNAVYQNMMLYGTDAFYDKVRARHILIKTIDDANQPYSPEDYAAARTSIEDLLARAEAGEDFATLATEYTEDPGSVESGGEYTFGRGEMVPEFEAAAYGLEIGGISNVVETQYGFHIIMLEERIPSTDEEKAKAIEDLAGIEEEAKYALKITEFDNIYVTLLEDYNVEVKEDVWASMTFKDAPVAE